MKKQSVTTQTPPTAAATEPAELAVMRILIEKLMEHYGRELAARAPR